MRADALSIYVYSVLMVGADRCVVGIWFVWHYVGGLKRGWQHTDGGLESTPYSTSSLDNGWKIGPGLADWSRIGIGLEDWNWIGGLVMDWQIGDGFADLSKVCIEFLDW